MTNTDARVNDYISKAADFAQPILQHLRTLVHRACPTVHESIKWSFPNFDYNGTILCSMASFKQHCSFNFWLANKMKDPEGLFTSGGDKSAMGQFGQIKTLSDLPPDNVLINYLHEAMQLIDQGAKLERSPKPKAAPATLPADFAVALSANPLANEHYKNFSNAQKNEYLTWIEEAKTESTRKKRIETATEWLSEGKIRNWKYLKSK